MTFLIEYIRSWRTTTLNIKHSYLMQTNVYTYNDVNTRYVMLAIVFSPRDRLRYIRYIYSLTNKTSVLVFVAD